MLAAKGITVHGVYPGVIDTDMLAGIDAPKTPAAELAVEVRSDEGCRYMDPIAITYTGAPFPSHGPNR